MPISLAGRFTSAVLRRRRQSSTLGFTLIELVVVVTILGITVSLILPSFGRGLHHWRLQGAVREVATLIKFAQIQSVASMRPLHVVLDRSRSLYWLDNADGPVVTDSPQAERKVRLYALPDGVRFGEVGGGGFAMDEERFRIIFFPRGSSSGGEVQLVDERGRAYQISVDSVTGRAGIARGEGKADGRG